jgi:hypothetical protein
MAQRVMIKHEASGLVRPGYVGFSWTYLFFGWFVPLIRGEIGIAALHVLFTFLTFGLWQLVFCFFYNKQYMTRKLTSGWVLADSPAMDQLAALKLGIALPQKCIS